MEARTASELNEQLLGKALEYARKKVYTQAR